uniref:Uncharacterized protein n=1 Tax=Anguilla anguilla TaxID=7936 RepID=A0A0E9PMR3_ANGAN
MTNGEELKLKWLGATYHFYAISDIIESRIIQCQRAPHKLFGRQNPVVRFQREKTLHHILVIETNLKFTTQAFFQDATDNSAITRSLLLPSIV